MIIREHINFERGIDPKSSIGIGVFSKIPKIGTIQPDSFDLKEIAKIICKVYSLPIINYTPIDEKSNFSWSEGYQDQWITMNLNEDRIVFERFLGPKYYDRIIDLMGKEYNKIPMRLGISAFQKHWISKNGGGYEFAGTKLYVFVNAGGYHLSKDFAKEKNISTWIPDRIKDEVMQRVIWGLRYKAPIFQQKTRQGPHMRDREHIKIDVRKYCKKYGQPELESLMKQNYIWTQSVNNWKITNGILEFID
jgi:hypothetical protein